MEPAATVTQPSEQVEHPDPPVWSVTVQITPGLKVEAFYTDDRSHAWVTVAVAADGHVDIVGRTHRSAAADLDQLAEFFARCTAAVHARRLELLPCGGACRESTWPAGAWCCGRFEDPADGPCTLHEGHDGDHVFCERPSSFDPAAHANGRWPQPDPGVAADHPAIPAGTAANHPPVVVPGADLRPDPPPSPCAGGPEESATPDCDYADDPWHRCVNESGQPSRQTCHATIIARQIAAQQTGRAVA